MLTMLLLLTAAAHTDTDRLLSGYRRATQVAVRCAERAEPDEVVVCGRRRTDRYRLPFIERGDGGSRIDPTPAQREALLVPPSKCEELSPFLVGCGSVGIGMTLSSDGKRRIVGLRELAP